MQKINKIISSILLSILALFVFAGSALAFEPKISITKLPGDMNNSDVKISYSALTSDPASIQVQFSIQKGGDPFTNFGPVLTGASGQVDLNGQMGESGKVYTVKAIIIGTEASDTTSTSFDQTNPSAPTEYSKERTSSTSYKISWKNSDSSDFSKTYVYRSKEANFTADNAHKIVEVGGGPSDTQTWNDSGLEADVNYYYALRTVDKAKNSSSLVYDGESVVVPGVLGASTVNTGVTTKKISLPKEDGQVLSATTTPTPEPSVLSKTVEGAKSFVATNGRKMALVGAAILGLLALGAFLFFQKKNK